MFLIYVVGVFFNLMLLFTVISVFNIEKKICVRELFNLYVFNILVISCFVS